MAAIPVNLRAVDPAQSILEKPSTAKILGHAATIDTTSSCEFGVGPPISGVEQVCVSQAGSSPSFTIGIDGNPDTLKDIKEGVVTASCAVYPGEMGRITLDTIRQHLEGKPIQPKVETPIKIIDQSNVDELLGK